MTTDPIVIVGAARTPMGGFLGDLKDVSAPAFGALAISAAVERAGIEAGCVDEILMGCVLPAGQGQAPARQAAIGAGLPLTAGATTINKMCGSGMKAAMVAHDLCAPARRMGRPALSVEPPASYRTSRALKYSAKTRA
jgi:acetyl-CoA C-acetyltransferase